MIYDIKSPEFAQAWRTVSESLLHFLQNGAAASIGAPLSVQVSAPTPAPTPTPIPVPPADRSVAETCFASVPIGNPATGYLFKSLGLKSEQQPNSVYKVVKYTDGSCEFSMCESLDAEARQALKDSFSATMPLAVGSVTGELTATCAIVNVQPGQGKIDGRSVRILAPMKVEFQQTN